MLDATRPPLLGDLQAAARDAYGEAAIGQPAMQAALATAAAALERVLREALDPRDVDLIPARAAPPEVGQGLTPPAPSLRITDAPAGMGLHELTAAQAARAIRSRALSPVDLVEALLTRAGQVDGYVQAWEALDADRAMTSARAAEAQLAGGAQVGALHGVPFGVKDIFDTAGLRTAAGFRPYDDRVPAEDAAVVARLKRAGALLLGKMVATQFAFTDPSRTRNPWSPERTPAGSSSGSGAGVAAREVPLAIGSQTAGSVLRPAAYNGVVGFKPTYGVVDIRGAFPLAWSLDHAGILARSVEDCGLFFAAAADDPDRGARGVPETRPPRLGLVRDCLDVAEPEVRAHVETIAGRFERAGAAVRETRLPYPFDLILAIHRVTLLSEVATAYSSLWLHHREEFGPVLRAGIQTGRLLPGYAYLHAQRWRRLVDVALRATFADVDVWLLPTAASEPPGMETTGDPSLQIPASLVGFPSISLPSGLAASGLPLAMQLVGPPGQDARLLAAAQWCETQLPAMPAPSLELMVQGHVRE